jgi:hypothetical protein
MTFFKLVSSDKEITKGNLEEVPTIVWQEDEKTLTTWTYETVEQRDNDFDVIMKYRTVR